MEEQVAKNEEKVLTKAELRLQELEFKAKQKEFNDRRNQEKTFLKKEADFMELEYKYMELMMALPAMRGKFQEFMNKAQAGLQPPVKMSEENDSVPDNVVEMKVGTPIVNEE